VLVALTGAFIAYKKYSGKISEEKTTDVFHVDQAYGFFFGKGLDQLAKGMNRFIETMLIQRVIRFSSAVVELSGNIIRVTQVGSAQAYLMMIVLAVFGILTWIYLGVGQYGKL
jgi:NADH:ubiquinone oxidoreductase subunit 5 (subunit L)/multisubunit Na+/H+ antiporter MnhA subunit